MFLISTCFDICKKTDILIFSFYSVSMFFIFRILKTWTILMLYNLFRYYEFESWGAYYVEVNLWFLSGIFSLIFLISFSLFVSFALAVCLHESFVVCVLGNFTIRLFMFSFFSTEVLPPWLMLWGLNHWSVCDHVDNRRWNYVCG